MAIYDVQNGRYLVNGLSNEYSPRALTCRWTVRASRLKHCAVSAAAKPQSSRTGHVACIRAGAVSAFIGSLLQTSRSEPLDEAAPLLACPACGPVVAAATTPANSRGR